MPQQTPPPAQGQGGGTGVDRAELEGIIRDQVKDIVREELPNMIRGIMGDLFNQKILPRLVKHSEEKVTAMLDEQMSTIWAARRLWKRTWGTRPLSRKTWAAGPRLL